MHVVPKTPTEALAVFRSREAEEWERDYAAGMITSLDEALPDLIAVACDPGASAGFQQRAAEVLSFAWKPNSPGLLVIGLSYTQDRSL